MTARHWTINGRFLAQSGTGVQRYAHEVVRALDAVLVDHPGLARRFAFEIVAPPDAAVPAPLAAIGFRRVGSFGGHLWEQTVLPQFAPGGLLSLCNTGPVRHPRHIACIHDMNTRICPQSYARGFRAAYRVLLPALGRAALVVATVSRFSAGEIARFGICPSDKIAVIPNGHEHVSRWQPEQSPASRVATSSTIAMIGSHAPHKNLGIVLNLAHRLKAAGLGVVVIGSADLRVHQATTAGKADNVTCVGRLSDPEMAAVLKGCLCLAFPSLTEGFGLPPLEAMALGCPVVASDRASMPEVCGDAALYAPPDDLDAWFKHFVDLRQSPALRARLAARGLERCPQFSWRRAAESYLRAMADADGVAHDLVA